jgi:hypothetical protein
MMGSILTIFSTPSLHIASALRAASFIAERIGLFDKAIEYAWAAVILVISSQVVLFRERQRVESLDRPEVINFSLNIYEPLAGAGEVEMAEAEVRRLRLAVLEKKAAAFDLMVVATASPSRRPRGGKFNSRSISLGRIISSASQGSSGGTGTGNGNGGTGTSQFEQLSEEATAERLIAAKEEVDLDARELADREAELRRLYSQPLMPRPGGEGEGPAACPADRMILRQRTLLECPLERALPQLSMQNAVNALARRTCSLDDPVVPLVGERGTWEGVIRLAIFNFLCTHVFPKEGYLKHAIYGGHTVTSTKFLVALTFEPVLTLATNKGEQKFRVVVIRKAQLQAIHQSARRSSSSSSSSSSSKSSWGSGGTVAAAGRGGDEDNAWLYRPQVEKSYTRMRLKVLRAMARHYFDDGPRKKAIQEVDFTAAAAI